MNAHSPNYDFVVKQAFRDDPRARVLDYGCGTGILVRRALDAFPDGDMYGVDTFEGFYENWQAKLPPELTGRIRRIEDGHIPFPDDHFDVIVSNQVFEHIDDPPPYLREIRRVLKPGGRFLALFPDREIWWEGHLGLWLPHRLDRFPRLQAGYIHAMRKLGFGYYKGNRTIRDWAVSRTKCLREVCFYHRNRDIMRWWREVFGAPPQSLARDYMLFRIAASPRMARFLPMARLPLAGPFLEFVCVKRAGLVLDVRKAG
ncbi:MAG: class I SAM-dependent methyltransferase [Rhodobiaceae bacterium]|nr:class I SAM-dependent methyltransferase [Rhodobiaceae bacterium]